MRKTHGRRLYPRLAVLTCAVVTPAASAAELLHIYHVGNSLTYHATAGNLLRGHANSRGINYDYGAHILCGASLQEIYTHPPAEACVVDGFYGYWNTALPNNQWDSITLQIYGDTLPGAETVIPQMMQLARTRPDNATTKFYLYENFPQELSGVDYSDRWVQPYDGTRPRSWTRDFRNLLMSDLEIQHPGDVPTLIPSGEVIYRLDQLAHAGQLPGVNDVIEWYNDPYHLNTFGTYAAETTMFAVMFEQNPAGLSPPSGMSAALAAKITDVVWEVVSEPKAYGQWRADQSGVWSNAGAWAGTVPNGTGAAAYLNGAIGLARTITLDSNVTLGHLSIDCVAAPYTIAGSATLSSSRVRVVNGNHTIAAPFIPQAQTTFLVAPGRTLTLSDFQPSAAAITVEGGGFVEVNSVSANSMTVSAGTFRINPSGPAASASRLNSLSITGKLDLTNNKLATRMPAGTWDGSAYTGVTGLVVRGRNGGAWNGTSAIITSMTQAVAYPYTTLGVASAADVTGVSGTDTAIWAGQIVSEGDTLVMYTYAGDANLDGVIDIDDYTRIDQSINLGVAGWSNGDFNYDGKLNIDDYVIIDLTLPNQQGRFIASGGGNPATVPEPASAGVIGLAAMSVMSRRRRR